LTIFWKHIIFRWKNMTQFWNWLKNWSFCTHRGLFDAKNWLSCSKNCSHFIILFGIYEIFLFCAIICWIIKSLFFLIGFAWFNDFLLCFGLFAEAREENLRKNLFNLDIFVHNWIQQPKQKKKKLRILRCLHEVLCARGFLLKQSDLMASFNWFFVGSGSFGGEKVCILWSLESFDVQRFKIVWKEQDLRWKNMNPMRLLCTIFGFWCFFLVFVQKER